LVGLRENGVLKVKIIFIFGVLRIY